MTFAELVAEAQRLARRCLHLVAVSTHDAPPVAVWGGAGPPASRNSGRHWLTVSSARLSPVDGQRLPGGSLTVRVSARGGRATVETASDDILPALLGDGSATPLVARDEISLPPLDAVFRFGSPRVRAWLESLGWIENDVPYPYTDAFPQSEPTAEYERYWQQRHPFYTGGVHAIVGGWHMPWPDGDWSERLADRLLLWTLADAEPWVELWLTAEGVVQIRERIT